MARVFLDKPDQYKIISQEIEVVPPLAQSGASLMYRFNTKVVVEIDGEIWEATRTDYGYLTRRE